MAELDDNILKMFIDQAFDVFDNDRSGALDVKQLHTFLNQLYMQMNQPKRFTAQETQAFLKTFDLNQNGVITKPELFMFFKRLSSGGFNQQPQYQNQPQYNQPQQYNQQQYGQQQQYNQPQYGQQPNPQYGQQPHPQQHPQQPYPQQQYGQQGQHPQQYPQQQQPVYYAQQGNNPQGTDPNNPYLRHG